ncbi:YccS family putative transporter [Arsenophonus nasoniae]|uniref:YccS family putative transporter n=1 Tax=Arsenophonus nasoniae TaxID=638 RepID=A0AA95GX22_9GAMM|nr:YccS family putative transporter [Arsenophonus nasoniae]WGM02665.1 YccS family putative transporter [Arsenophonus nasoniae]
MLTMFSGFRHVFYNSNILYYIRILIALSGTALIPWILGEQLKITIPLTLGVVAAALTDLDDRFIGKLRNIAITLLSFLIASVSVELLFPYPWLFFIGLALSSFSFTFLSVLGLPYGTIAFGALLVAIYTMLGTAIFSIWYQQPILLLIGAIWYYLLTLISHIFLPIQPLHNKLAQCYQQLAIYLANKANLFNPEIEENYQQSIFDLAMANSKLVNTMNQMKVILLSRLKNNKSQSGTNNSLNYYFIVQDIHERASSSHIKYQNLSQDFPHSDILFRFQKLLSMQAEACQLVAHSILSHTRYQHNAKFKDAFIKLEKSLQYLTQQYSNNKQISTLYNLLINLKEIDTQLNSIAVEQIEIPYGQALAETQLSDNSLSNINYFWLTITSNLTLNSTLFRHAIRMSVVLCTGYIIVQCFNLPQGYWILLTSLFVCQPNYIATKNCLILRILGTIAAILIGLPLLYFVPSIEGQLLLIIISGVFFFACRNSQYAQATLFITLLVLLSFNLLGEGFNVMLPRIMNTIIGCGIAWIAVNYIWPDWKFRQLPKVLQQTLHSNCRYLAAILFQYHQGRNNSVDYRIARRDAHINDAELVSVLSDMLARTKTNSISPEKIFRLLCLNHSMLSYISALGAHREQLNNQTILSILDNTIAYIESALNFALLNNQIVKELNNPLIQRFQTIQLGKNNKEQLIVEQLLLLINLLPEITSLIVFINQQEPD